MAERWEEIRLEVLEPFRFDPVPGDGTDPRRENGLALACKRIADLESEANDVASYVARCIPFRCPTDSDETASVLECIEAAGVRIAELEAEVAVLRSCKEETDAGNGPCGVCVVCYRRRIAELEQDRDALDSLRNFLGDMSIVTPVGRVIELVRSLEQKVVDLSGELSQHHDAYAYAKKAMEEDVQQSEKAWADEIHQLKNTVKKLEGDLRDQVRRKRVTHSHTRDRWIPVEEQMPEPFQDVLVWFQTSDHGALTHGYGWWDHDADGWDVAGTGSEPIEVTHWRPLPEGPK